MDCEGRIYGPCIEYLALGVKLKKIELKFRHQGWQEEGNRREFSWNYKLLAVSPFSFLAGRDYDIVLVTKIRRKREELMGLQLARHQIRKIILEKKSRLEGPILYVDAEEVQSIVRREKSLRLVRIATAHPGDPVRMGPVLDVVEPRAKDDPQASAFPGWTGPPRAAGLGRTHVLSGMALVAVGRLAGVQEGIIDMGAEASSYSPFARTHNLILVFDAAKEANRVAVDEAIRRSLLRIAEYLASLARKMEPDHSESWEWPPAPCSLPRAALVYLVQSQGELRRTYLYGQPVDSIVPTLLDPLEVLDGAVVSGNFVLPSNKTCTYIHQNHPPIIEMLRRHGADLAFSGVILANEASLMADKERSAQFTEKLARLLGVHGVLINQEGGANTITDVMMLCRLLSRSGIKTVLLVNEFAGGDGTTPSLAETTPEATAIVSAGNNDHRITLPARKEFIGFAPLAGLEGDAAGEIVVPLSRIYASTNQLGFNILSCRTR
jgi:glycine reductase complex component B subunit alpha and beta